MARKDPHRPVNLVPEDYTPVGYYDCGWDSDGFSTELPSSYDPVGPYADKPERCDHCGAHIRYGCILAWAGGGHIHVGEICMGNRFTLSTAKFQKLRKAAALDRKAQKIKTAWAEYRAANEADWEALDASENGFVQDVLRKGRLYGNLSDKQLAAIQKAVDQDVEKMIAAAAAPPTAPVPTGKGVAIEGVVVSVKWQDSYYGGTQKMLVVVETPEGEFKVWGTVPSSLPNTEKGDRVSFVAEVSPSEDDKSFGFFKRPRNAQVVEEGFDGLLLA